MIPQIGCRRMLAALIHYLITLIFIVHIPFLIAHVLIMTNAEIASLMGTSVLLWVEDLWGPAQSPNHHVNNN